MGQSSVVHYHHIIFSTKHRKPILQGERKEQVWKYIAGIIRNMHCSPVAIGGTNDHVHILVQVDARLLVPTLVRGVKANSSRWLRETYPEIGKECWQDGYGSYSISVTHVSAVRRYIARQEEHHRKRSFEYECTVMRRAAENAR